MCGPKFCSMEITQQIREFAEAQGVSVDRAVAVGMAGKAAEYRAAAAAGPITSARGQAGERPE
jgi:phosphomethylpyrimidine synthase